MHESLGDGGIKIWHFPFNLWYGDYVNTYYEGIVGVKYPIVMTACIAGLYDSQKAAGLLAIDRDEAHIHYSETKHGGQRLDDIQS